MASVYIQIAACVMTLENGLIIYITASGENWIRDVETHAYFNNDDTAPISYFFSVCFVLFLFFS